MARRVIRSKINSEVGMGSFIKELWSFLRVRRKLWITPIVLIMVVVAALLIAAQGSVLAPFIYALF